MSQNHGWKGPPASSFESLHVRIKGVEHGLVGDGASGPMAAVGCESPRSLQLLVLDVGVRRWCNTRQVQVVSLLFPLGSINSGVGRWVQCVR